jgi:hypothetical protein
MDIQRDAHENMRFIPDYAARKFAEDARRRIRRRTLVLQVSDNKADSAKLRAPCGFKCRTFLLLGLVTIWVNIFWHYVSNN